MAARKINIQAIVMRGAAAGAGGVVAGFIKKKVPAEYEKYSNWAPVLLGGFLMTQKQQMVQDLGLGMMAAGAADLAEQFIPGITGADDPVNGPMLTAQDVDDLEQLIAEGLSGADYVEEVDFEEMNGADDPVNGFEDDFGDEFSEYEEF